MQKYSFVLMLSLIVCNAYAGGFDTVVANARENCGGISTELSDLKKMAGINTAVTAVGTATATGATVVGVVKSSVDKDLHAILDKVNKPDNVTKNPSVDDAVMVYDEYIKQYGGIEQEQSDLTGKSKSLGYWRTGLLGTGAAANVAGAIIAGNNKVDDDLQTKIDKCIQSVRELENVVGQARLDGLDTTNAREIITKCAAWKNADLSVINNRAKGAMISSVVGATTGVVGTITSAVANSDNVRQGNRDKEESLNRTSNVLAGGTAVAGGVATVFNAAQISAVKKIVEIADSCERTLK